MAACTPYVQTAPKRSSSAAQQPANIATGQVSTSRSGIVTVRAGDSVYGIAQRYGVPQRALIEANRLSPPYVLRVGQQLRLPLVKTYTVASGDTLYAISRRFNTDVPSLARLNDLGPPYPLQVGQRLILENSITQTAMVNDGEREERQVMRNVPLPLPKPKLDASGNRVMAPEAKETPPQVAVRQVAKSAAPPPPPPRAGGRFLWPLQGRVISSFGPVGGGLYNDGINIAVPTGTPVQAADNGSVVYAGNEIKGFGNLLLIKHADGWMTAYAHNDKLLVAKGDLVKKGQKIALSGQSGNVDSPQLHFEVRRGAKPVDPLPQMANRGS